MCVEACCWDDGSMLQITQLSKSYGKKQVVTDLSFSVPNGQITGFLGPNGSGKSTTMRMICGLEPADAGNSTFDGVPFRQLAQPATVVGAMLDPTWLPKHLRIGRLLQLVASAGRIDQARIPAVLRQVGLAGEAGRKIGQCSLGMKQRVSLAVALLSEPTHLLLDEPSNGLDPEGVAWMRQMMRTLAGEGLALLVSSHLLAEMENTVDRLVVIGQGRLVFEGDLTDFLANQQAQQGLVVETLAAARLEQLLQERQLQVLPGTSPQELVVTGQISRQEVAQLAASAGVPILSILPQRTDLETAFIRATHKMAQYTPEGVNTNV